jgi:hypothetical protein
MDFRVAMALVGMSSSSAIKQSAAVPVPVEVEEVEVEERATFILAMFTDARCRTASTYTHIIDQNRLYTRKHKEEKRGNC